MEVKRINEILNNKQKGTFIRIGWRSNIESAAARKSGVRVVKQTDTTVRWGIKYDNLKRVKALKAEALALKATTKEYTPWCKHVEGFSHLVESIREPGKTYIQLFPIGKKGVTKTRYYINGVEKTKQEVIDSGYVNNSEWIPKGDCLIMNIPTANIRFIGKEA